MVMANLVISGSGFLDTTTADLDGQPLAITTQTGTRLTLHATEVQVGEAREATLHVNNPLGSSEIGVEVDNPVPTLTSISPTSVTHHSGSVTLTLTGTDFRTGSTALASGSSCTTTYVSDTQLTAVVPSGKVIHAGTVPITVSSPTPGGGNSGTVNLTAN